MLAWLERDDPFPPVAAALKDPSGLLCAGADLSVPRLLQAYRSGIFPWYSGGEPILWWSPDPRMVLFCDELKVSVGTDARRRFVCLRIRRSASSVTRAFASPAFHWKGAIPTLCSFQTVD